jgi:hypothetical protein
MDMPPRKVASTTPSDSAEAPIHNVSHWNQTTW